MDGYRSPHWVFFLGGLLDGEDDDEEGLAVGGGLRCEGAFSIGRSGDPPKWRW
jgi:hypothetical protein